MCKKLFFLFFYFVITVNIAFGTEKFLSNLIDIDIKSEIKKIKITILETCTVNQINNKYSKINNKKENNTINDIFLRIINNLNIVNLFSVIQDSNSCDSINQFFVSKEFGLIDEYVYENFSENSDFVVSSTLRTLEDKKIRLELLLWDVADQRMVAGQYFIINEYNLKKISNIISDFIYTNTTGEKKGIFNSKIIYIAETGSIKNRQKAVRIMNFNGENNIKITNGKDLTITPIFSRSDIDEIFYLQYKNRKVFLYQENLRTQERNILKVGDGIVFAPNFNPTDKNQMALAIADKVGTNLYLLNTETNKYFKLTNDTCINTSPNFSSSGDSIVFVSDRSGSKKIYSLNLITNEILLLSKNPGIYDKPIWAPDENLIAFIKIQKGKFILGLMTPDGENERYLTEGYLLEGIRWSPNSRYIIYYKQKGPYGKESIPRLYMIDIMTNYEYELNTIEEEGASDPDWIMYE